MTLFMAQLLILIGIAAFITAPIALLVFGGRFALRGKSRRGFLVTASFTAGALAGGFGAWQLVPSTWTLPFWETCKATMDAEKYTHAVEHYAEGVVLMLICAALLLGVLGAATAALCTRPARATLAR